MRRVLVLPRRRRARRRRGHRARPGRARRRGRRRRPRASISSRPSSSSRARRRRSPPCTSSRTRSSRTASTSSVAELEGHPIVINKWASWCRPCRAEFPIFQQVATDRGKEVAFLGVNAADKRPAAEKFLAERPLPYPSYEDPDEDIAARARGGQVLPDDDLRRREGRHRLRQGRRVHLAPPSSRPTSTSTSARERAARRPAHGSEEHHRVGPGRPPRRPLRPPAAAADRRLEGPVRARPRGPDAARGLRGAARRRRAGHAGLDRPRGAEPLSRAHPGRARARGRGRPGPLHRAAGGRPPRGDRQRARRRSTRSSSSTPASSPSPWRPGASACAPTPAARAGT